jgi:hypothetical protein
VLVDTKYNFGRYDTASRGSDYLASACEQTQPGPGTGGDAVNPKPEDPGAKDAGKVKHEGKGANGEGEKRTNVGIERVHEWRYQVNDALQLDKSVDDGRGSGGVKKKRT